MKEETVLSDFEREQLAESAVIEQAIKWADTFKERPDTPATDDDLYLAVVALIKARAE
jgi:hypothetical protein